MVGNSVDRLVFLWVVMMVDSMVALKVDSKEHIMVATMVANLVDQLAGKLVVDSVVS